MTVVTPDQGLILPLQADAANEQTVMANYNGGVESRLVLRYTTAADRTTRNPSPTAGQISFLTSPGRWDVCKVGGGSPVWWEMLPVWVRKPTETQTVTSSTAFVSDDALVLPYAANARYTLDGLVVWDSGTTADIKFQWAISGAGATFPWWQVSSVDTGLVYNIGQAAGLTGFARGGAGIGSVVFGAFKGTFTTGANVGNLTLQWAQNASEAVATRIKTDSWLQLTRVG